MHTIAKINEGVSPLSEVISVTELNDRIKLLIDNSPELHLLRVRGEISNFKSHGSGHLYFSVKDENAVIRCVMFRSSAYRLKFLPENGMKVLLSGSVSVYVKDGSYQLYVTDMEPDGIGALYVAFEQLKQRLDAEGLFNPAHKKPLPLTPKTVGVVTSPTGAAVRDIINVTGRRFPMAKILLFPALVQGDGAAESIISGIRFFNEHRSADVIIVGRGGGSIEDLWAFNDECLAREIYASEIPVISAVGHETDFTIADFVADVRAATPSAAAELAVPDATSLMSGFIAEYLSMRASVEKKIRIFKEAVQSIFNRGIRSQSERYYNERKMRTLMLEQAINSSRERLLSVKKAQLSEYSARLSALNPMSVLARGYSVTVDKNGESIADVDKVGIGDNVGVILQNGELFAKITDKKRNV